MTFNKRRFGLMKKAMELSVLCECDIAIIVMSGDKLYQYSNTDIYDLIRRFSAHEGSVEAMSNNDVNSI